MSLKDYYTNTCEFEHCGAHYTPKDGMSRDISIAFEDAYKKVANEGAALALREQDDVREYSLWHPKGQGAPKLKIVFENGFFYSASIWLKTQKIEFDGIEKTVASILNSLNCSTDDDVSEESVVSSR